MQLPPPEVLLSWPAPNYKSPITRGNELLVITCVLFPIAMFMVSLRIFTRLRITKAWGIDDILLLCAVPPTLAIAVSTIYAVKVWGWDRHIWDVPFTDITNGLRLLIALICLFAVGVSFYKLSILILTKRIMINGTGLLRHIATAGMFLVVAEALIFCIVVINTCSPVSAYWTLSFKPQHCVNEKLHLLVGGIINTTTDFLVFFLPLPTVLKLKIPFRQQLVLGFLFGAGFAVCVAGIARIIYTWKATSSYDRTWVSYGLWISSLIELYVGLICASIPGCKPFFTRYLPGMLGSSIGRSEGATADFTTADRKSRPHGTLISGNETHSKSASAFAEEDTNLQSLGKMEATVIYTCSDAAQFMRATSDLDQIPQGRPDSRLTLQTLPKSHRGLHFWPSPNQRPAMAWSETPIDAGEESAWEERSDGSSEELQYVGSDSAFNEKRAACKRRSRTPRSIFSNIVGQEKDDIIRSASSKDGSMV